MAKEEALELEGDRMILVYTAGKMRKHRIRSMVGDRVTVEMTPYDLTRGRLIFRHREGAAPTGGARRAPYRPRR